MAGRLKAEVGRHKNRRFCLMSASIRTIAGRFKHNRNMHDSALLRNFHDTVDANIRLRDVEAILKLISPGRAGGFRI